jgi:RecB family endonuclease NucS
MEYNRHFSLYAAYEFLSQHGLEKESADIRNSSDKFMSYNSTLRRAKIMILVRDKKLLDEFCNSVWQSGLTEKGNTRIRFFENLVERFNAVQEGKTSEDEEDKIATEENEFAYENDLRNYLVRNLSVIERGLRIYDAQDGTTRAEFIIPGTSRRIDILAIDNQNNFVVIELKVSRGYEKVVGQTLYNQSMVKTHFKHDKVRAIIIAREITPELKAATLFLPDIELFEYQMAVTLNRIK